MIELSPFPPSSPAATTIVAATVRTTPGSFGQALGAFIDALVAKGGPQLASTPDRQDIAADGKGLPAGSNTETGTDTDDQPDPPAAAWLPVGMVAPAALPTMPTTTLPPSQPTASAAPASLPARSVAPAPLPIMPTTTLSPLQGTPDAVVTAAALAGPALAGPTHTDARPAPPGGEAQRPVAEAAQPPAGAAAQRQAEIATPTTPPPSAPPPIAALIVQPPVSVRQSAPKPALADSMPVALARIDTAPTIAVSATPQPAGQIFAAAIAAATAWRDDTHGAHEQTDANAALGIVAPLRLDHVAVPATGGADHTALDLTQDPGLHRMIDRIETLRDAFSDEADARDTRIRLVPDALGCVDVAVRQDGDRVHVRFTTEHEATRALIAQAQPRLTELAAARGVRIGDTSVSADTPGGGGTTPQPRPIPQHIRPARAAAPDDSSTDHRLA